ncbi:YobI family P-loop NTPase [Thomasclavelia sp.]
MSKYYFEKLTPINDADIKIYEEAIDFVINDPEIKNIAISGSYGSGKSSLLESYKNKHKELKFLSISLTCFRTENEENAYNLSKKVQGSQENQIGENKKSFNDRSKESILEGKILNQLIHQIPPESIQQTNFRIKKEIDKRKNNKEAGIVTIFLIALFYTVFFKDWSNLINGLKGGFVKEFLYFTLSSYFRLFTGGLLVLLLFYFIDYLLKLQKNRNLIRRLNFQGNQIEIFEESDDSYFDKYLNEVLYLFEHVDADIIVFEDIDRFDADRIFERLREVNTLINRSFKKENKSKVLRFFYLLKDDIFVSKDRTKFFDFIIPVIPVIDSSNSYDKFISLLKKNNLFDKFDEYFLQNLSLYIDDMRLLKNICNEFIIYYYRLNTTDIKYNKMMAMITYKNLFPRDFSELQLNQGFVYALFANKDKFISDKKQEIMTLISETKEEIEYVKKESLESIQELNDVLDRKEYRVNRASYPEYNKMYQELNEWKDITYIKRKQSIESKLNGNIEILESELANLTKELNKINEYTLCEIITRDNIDDIFNITVKNEIGEVRNFKEVKANAYFNLLKYVIREGYIDETYSDYMTYFYEEGLSKTDKLFLQSVTDKKAKEFSYKLKEPQKVFVRLRVRDFEEEETLNFSLIDYMLNNHIHSDQLAHFIAAIQKTRNYEFVFMYIDATSSLPLLIKTLNKKWSSFFNEILSSEKYSNSDKLRKYSLFTLLYSNNQDVQNVNIDNCLRDYISNTRDYLNINNPNISRLISKFKLLEVSFLKIDYKTVNKELFKNVYTNSLYDLNFKNIKLILEKVYGITSEEDINYKNYSLIRHDLKAPLYDNVRDKMEKYIKIILDNCNQKIIDDENSATEILNAKNIDLDNKKTYLNYYQNVISKIKSIEDKNLWDALLDNRIIDYSERNIIDYFLEKDLNSHLVNYINNGEGDIDFNNISEEYKSEDFENLFDKAIVTNELNNLKYKQIITSLNFDYEGFDVLGIENDKLIIVIDENIIRMNSETLLFMRENYSDSVLYYIKKNIYDYKEIMDEDLFSHDELLEILSWDIEDNIKLKLLEFSSEPITILEENYSNNIEEYILNNNLDDEDMYTLFEKYDDLKPNIQLIVFKYALNHITNAIMENFPNVSYQLKIKLLESPELDYDEKFNILITMLPTLDKENAIRVLAILDLRDYTKILNTIERPKFKISSQSKKLLNEFVSKGWLYDYQEDLEKDGYYKIRRHAPKKKKE